MKIKHIAFFALCVVGLSFKSINEWIKVETSDYSIEFPSEPTAELQNLESAIGPLVMDIRMYEVIEVEKDDNYAYGIISTTYPADMVHSDMKASLDTFFEGAVNGSVQNLNGKLLSQKVIEINGYPGREFRIDFQEGVAIVKMKAVLVKNKMMILQTICDPAKEGNAAAVRFFDSFKLKG